MWLLNYFVVSEKFVYFQRTEQKRAVLVAIYFEIIAIERNTEIVQAYFDWDASKIQEKKYSSHFEAQYLSVISYKRTDKGNKYAIDGSVISHVLHCKNTYITFSLTFIVLQLPG